MNFIVIVIFCTQFNNNEYQGYRTILSLLFSDNVGQFLSSFLIVWKCLSLTICKSPCLYAASFKALSFSQHSYVEYFIDVFIQLPVDFIDAVVVAFYWPSHNREIGTPVLLHSSKSLLWKKLEFMFPSHVLVIFLFRSGLNCIHWSQVYYWMDNYVRGKYRSLTKYIFVAVGKLQAQNFWPKLKVCINPGIWIYRNFKVP